MLAFRVIARIDIKNEFVVKGIQLEGLRKVGDPVEFAKKYNDQGIDEIIFYDTVASYYGRNSLENIINKTCENVFTPVAVSGGIRTEKDVKTVLRNGADKVVVNTAFIKNPDFINKISKILGAQSVVASIEAKKIDDKWVCYYDNGRESSNKSVLDWIKEVQDRGAGEILLTSVDRDGTKKGFDIELLENIYDYITVPFVISGGFGKLEHLYFLKDYKNVNAVAIGTAFHYSLYSIKEVKDYLKLLGLKVRN